MGSTGSSTSVSLQNSGTVSVTTGIGEEAAPSNFYAGNTSITNTNTGEIEVIGSSFSVASVTNTGNGTFKVEGTSKLEIGTLSGTITLNKENVTLNASNITGGSLSATSYGAIFTGANTLNGVALNATGKTVTVGNSDSLTVKGTSTLNIGTLSGTIKTDANELTTLNASNITGGSIYAQNDLTFTGANALNDITLDASGKTVTVGTVEGDSLTVGGTSTLTIGTLDGEIKTASNTTLQNSSITGGGTNGGTITAQGAITVNNSTIASSKFTATTVNGVDFYGQNTLDGVTLETGTSEYVGSVYISETLTIKGKSTLKTPGLLGTRTINLDGAEIVDSRILGNNGAGGTLVVESGKTATFSTTGSNSNDFGRTSINNSGTINVNGRLFLSTTTGTISNSGTINVNGRLSTGAITNTNGTIALNGGATVSSTISGGSITTSNAGTVTVQDSTISSSAFTTTADEVIFYYRNTLNSVTLDATGKTVTVNGTLTVKGTSTLNATNITGGTISAQDNLTFTGTNTLNGVTLDATGNTVTIGNDDEIADSLTVKGTNTLNIGTLNGTITTDADALTTLNATSITGGSISAQNNLTFTGANTLNRVTLNAAGKTVTVGTGNSDSLTVGGTSTLNIGTLNGEIKTGSAGTTLTGSDITGGGTNGGTITALGTLTFANKTHLRNITLDALDQTVDTGSSYSLWLGGAITLKIGTLISSIQLDEDTTFTNSTISNGNNSSRLFIYGGKVVTFAGANTIFDAEVHATGYLENDGGSITVKSKNNVKGELTVYRIKNSGNITVGSAGSDNEAADACSLTGTLLNNGGTITVNGKDQANRSLLDAAYITNGDNNNHTGMMSLTNAVLNATKLENYAPGIFRGTSAITISDSTVSIKESLTNGATNNIRATIEFNNSTVTADSVTNYGTHNGTDWPESQVAETGKVGFALTDCMFTVNNTLTNYGWIYVTSSTLQAASVVNNGNRFYVYGTSTLEIGLLTGRIDIINGNDTGSLVTLNNSHITGKVNDNGTLGSSIHVTNPLTFTGTNTLTNTQFYATAANKTVTVGDSDPEADSLTLTNSTVGCTVKVQSGATLTLDGMNTITTLDLSEASEGSVTMDWQDKLSFTGFGDSYENKLTINLDNFTSGDLSKPILDSVNNDWTKDMYEALLKNDWSSDQNEKIQYEFYVKGGDLYVNMKEIVVENGTYTEITELNGVKTVIQEGTGTTEFTRAVYGGTKVDAAGSVTRDTDVTIETGTFEKFFVGGNNIAMPTAETTYTVSASAGQKQSVTIEDGVFEGIVATSDRVQKGAFTLNSDLEMNISGGQFNYFVAGGLLNSLYENTGEVEKTNGTANIYGDISLNITGGIFANDCWIYGGCVSTSRSVSSYASTIYGDVTVTVDCGAGNSIQLSHVVAGSHGLGQILVNSSTASGGNTAVVFKGNGTNLSFTADGELWGGSGRDNVSPISGKCTGDSLVAEDRLLSFEGFTSNNFNCSMIRDFKSIQLIDESNVNLTETTVDLKGIENWTFEYDSSLSGNFGNNFTGDMLNLTGIDALSSGDWTILTNSSSTAFKGFGSFDTVSFGTGEGSAASYNSTKDVWYNAAYVLYRSENSMLLTTNASYTERFGSIA